MNALQIKWWIHKHKEEAREVERTKTQAQANIRYEMEKLKQYAIQLEMST